MVCAGRRIDGKLQKVFGFFCWRKRSVEPFSLVIFQGDSSLASVQRYIHQLHDGGRKDKERKQCVEEAVKSAKWYLVREIQVCNPTALPTPSRCVRRIHQVRVVAEMIMRNQFVDRFILLIILVSSVSPPRTPTLACRPTSLCPCPDSPAGSSLPAQRKP